MYVDLITISTIQLYYRSVSQCTATHNGRKWKKRGGKKKYNFKKRKEKAYNVILVVVWLTASKFYLVLTDSIPNILLIDLWVRAAWADSISVVPVSIMFTFDVTVHSWHANEYIIYSAKFNCQEYSIIWKLCVANYFQTQRQSYVCFETTFCLHRSTA